MDRTEYEKRLEESRQVWNKAADTFDNEPDHGLGDGVVRTAWMALLRSHLPASPASILDIGCGTGSLSIVLAELGHHVMGIDLSPAMIARARQKAVSHGYAIQFQVMDAAFPKFEAQQFEVIVCRHLLWTLSDIGHVVQRWTDLLKPEGRFLLVEGFWNTGAGLHANEIVSALPAGMTQIAIHDLSAQVELWGGAVTDERCLIVAHKPSPYLSHNALG
jgi:SAM-dependent methyltransferase